jgi:leucyl aminopeptidase
MNFDFKFPTIKLISNTKKTLENAKCILVPFTNIDKKVNIKEKYKETAKNLFDLANQKVNTSVSFKDGDKYYVFLALNTKQVEDSIAKAVMNIPSSIEDIFLDLEDIKIYDKLLISKILFENKKNWNLKSKKEETKAVRTIFISEKIVTEKGFNKGVALAESQALVQSLVNMPSNYLTPSAFADIAKQLAEKENFSCDVLDEKAIKKLNMGAFLGVAKGSSETPKIIVCKHNGKKSENNDITFVGKGLTFDSGGISIKPSLGMGAMKGDMAGAATSLGAVVYAAKNNLPINLVSILACCENMPSSKALKPGDVITAMNGTTIEVIDTDAEGRLVLADALHYSKEFKSKYTIDMATLTGACVVALGHVHTGMFSEDTNLINSLELASEIIKDKAWQLPMEEEHEEMLDSKVADIANLCIGKGAGAQNGAIFLKKFAPSKGWCHLDIAGTSASKAGEATSRPMPLISEFLDKL